MFYTEVSLCDFTYTAFEKDRTVILNLFIYLLPDICKVEPDWMVTFGNNSHKIKIIKVLGFY